MRNKREIRPVNVSQLCRYTSCVGICSVSTYDVFLPPVCPAVLAMYRSDLVRTLFYVTAKGGGCGQHMIQQLSFFIWTNVLASCLW